MGDAPGVGFTVRYVDIEELPDVETLAVGLTEAEDGNGPSLLFSIPTLPYDEQDRALGQDTYCVVSETGATVYGGLSACVLRDDVLILGFTAIAATALDLPRMLQLPLHVDAAAIAELRDGLRRVFSRTATPPATLIL